MNSKCRPLVQAWDAMQVELRGRYSDDRVLELEKYASQTTLKRVLVVLVTTPLPCLVVTLLIDLLPLSNPSRGIEENKFFLVREYYAYLVMTFLVISQFRAGVRVLPYPTVRVIRDTLLVSALCVGVLYGLVLVIGFPLPFTTLTVLPAWVALTVLSMAIQWTRKARATPKAGMMLFGMFKIWCCDILLVSIYPPYFYIFTTLSSDAQMVFTVLLPAIKIFMRNLFSRAVGHLDDEIPELVVFNADVFGSLFISYCMQSSPSIGTTLEIMAADIVMMGLALRDIKLARTGLGELERRVDEEHQWRSHHGDHKPSTSLQRASVLLQQQRDLNSAPAFPSLELKRVPTSLHQGLVGPKTIELKKKKTTSATTIKKLLDRDRIHPIVNLRQVQNEKVRNVGRSALRSSSIPSGMQYTRKVRRLLYMAEFLLLINYVEVIIPLVFSIYLVATFYLPNREFYAVYNDMNQHQLIETLNNVMFYCALQLVSLLVLVFVLRRMLGLSPVKQIAFVLEKQVAWVQMSLVFWLFYNVQGSLRHLGYDYSFRFAWLTNVKQN